MSDINKNLFKGAIIYLFWSLLVFLASPFIFFRTFLMLRSYILTIGVFALVYFLPVALILWRKLRQERFRKMFFATGCSFILFLIFFSFTLAYDRYFIPELILGFFVLMTVIMLASVFLRLALLKKAMFVENVLWYMPMVFYSFFILMMLVQFIGLSGADYYALFGGAPSGFGVIMVFLSIVIIGVMAVVLFVVIASIARWIIQKNNFLKDMVERILGVINCQKVKKIYLIVALLLMVALMMIPGIMAYLSFKELGGSYYEVNGKIYVLLDGSGVINAKHKELKEVDKSTFKFIDGGRARDKNHCYVNGKIAESKREILFCEQGKKEK